jgi:hypothetical protein
MLHFRIARKEKALKKRHKSLRRLELLRKMQFFRTFLGT